MKSPLQSPNPRPNLMYDYKGWKTPKNGWSISLERMKEWDIEGKLWFPEDKNQNINRKIYLDEYQGQPVSSLWSDISVINPMSKERSGFDNGQKPEALFKRIIEMCTDECDIVLDFHLGTGTTVSSAHKMNRQYIGIEQMDYIENVTCDRIKKVIDGEQGGISKSADWQGGGSFVYLELKKYNQTFIEQIEEATNTDSLLQIWEQMKAKSFLNYNVEIKKQDEHIEEFKALSLAEQKQHLCKLLDKNQLYVNRSSLNDADFACTEEEKKVTKDFYRI